VSATFLLVSDDPEHEICYGLAVLFNFDEAVQINVAFWVGQRTIDKKYPKELDKGNFIIIVVIFALIIQNDLPCSAIWETNSI
jgi:hypothetical protein